MFLSPYAYSIEMEQLTSKPNCSTTRSLQQLPVDSEANFSRSITSMLGCKTINSKSYLAILYTILKKNTIQQNASVNAQAMSKRTSIAGEHNV